MVDESEILNHHLREIEQINLILKKLVKAKEEKNFTSTQSNLYPFSNDDELSQLENLTVKLNEKSELIKNSDSSSDLLTKIHHELRTPIVPIKSYTEMLLNGHYGKLTDQQVQKINHIKSNIVQLENAVLTLFTKERFQNLTKNQKDQPHKIKELEQEKTLLKKLIQSEEQKSIKLTKKHYLTIVVSAITIAVIVSSYSVYVVNLIGEQYRVPNPEPVKSSYIIQNLKGDTIDTWLSWRLVDGSVLYVNILNADSYPRKAELIKEVILSDEGIEIDDSLLHKGPKGSTSTYYLGWAGALQKASDNPTQFYIPNKLEIIESAKGEGGITITLTNMRNGDGYSGFTKSIADESQNQILKSDITIYGVDNLSDNQFKTILRHELGHALGLAHSTAPEDLMYPTVQTEFPYISECDLDAIISLYDGSKNSEVVCEK